eukprot:GHUV01030497.1.p1 GENE.GHUV01030497.1~~GHUV01030497.1.p1  ORF type:complete len:151 (-),score=34.65 GHUV01030497.1:26-478(-)
MTVVHLVNKHYTHRQSCINFAAAPSDTLSQSRRLIEHAYDSDTEGDSGGGGASDDGTTADTHQQAEGATKSRGSASKASALDPETVFMQEVGETFLRCVKERFAETNAVIELNGLKIAEDRTFADCARYIFTALLQVGKELVVVVVVGPM